MLEKSTRNDNAIDNTFTEKTNAIGMGNATDKYTFIDYENSFFLPKKRCKTALKKTVNEL